MYDLIAGDWDGGAEIDDVGYEQIVAGDVIGDDVVGRVVKLAARDIQRAGGNPSPAAVLKRAVPILQRQMLSRERVDQMAQNNAIGVRPKVFTTSQVLPAPFDSNGTVAAGGSVTTIITSPVVWKPERLFIPSSIASDFTLDRLQVGLQNWLLTASSVPCEAFTEQATDNILRLDTLQIGQQLVAVFTNRSGAPLTLRGMWKGFVVF